MMLTFFDYADQNNNQYPMVYTNGTDPANPAPFYQQVNTHLANIRDNGLEPVPMSAYLDECLFISNAPMQLKAEDIVRKLNARAQLPSSEEEDHYDIVFIWDIDEITMLSRNYLAEIHMLRPDINVLVLFKLIRSLLLHVNFHDVDDIGDRDVVNIADAFVSENDEVKKCAPMYDSLIKLYNQFQNRGKMRGSIVPHDIIKKCGMIEEVVEIRQAVKKHQKLFNQRWKYAKKCIELVNKRSAKSRNKKYANVVLCEEGLALGASQLILSGCSPVIGIENLYSTRRVSLESTFERIQKKFGEMCLLVHVTSGPAYGDVPPYGYWQVTSNEAIKYLYNLQKNILLK